MTPTSRLIFDQVEGSQELFTPQFTEFLLALHDRFTTQIHVFREKRAAILNKALRQGIQPSHLAVSKINTGDWQVPQVPQELRKPGIEITGPASITGMFINALNPGPSGIRAEGDLDDDEDAAGHRFIDTITATHNRLKAVNRSLSFYDSRRDKEYKIQDGDLPFFMHRERGLHLDESDVLIDHKPVPAAILGTALTLFHAGRAQIQREQGIYFYLPKLESSEEAGFWKDFFDFSTKWLCFPKSAVIRAIPLIESLPAAYQMEEILYSLGPYAAGLNAARWDFKASIFEFIMTDSNSVWPDRFGVDIKTTDFLANIFRRLVAICLKRGAVPIGGMATALPSKNTSINEAAAATIRADKEWEAQQGFIRAWVAHIYHMKTAADPFKEIHTNNWHPSAEMSDPDNYPIEIKVPKGPITIEGSRRNVRMVIEYLEGWLNGRGAKGINSLSSKPGISPSLMEDLATGRMSVAQIAQRILHGAADSKTGRKHDFNLVKRLLNEEVEDILDILRKNNANADKSVQVNYRETETRYLKAVKIAMQWIKNYTDLNFRSLGSYTRIELESIATNEDAF